MKQVEENKLHRQTRSALEDPQEGEDTGCASQNPRMEDGCVTTRRNGRSIHCLTVIGQIEGHYILPSQNKTTKYEHVIPQIVAVEEDPHIDGLLMLLTTVGGHSIGVPLAVAAKRSFIAESASMTIHPVRMNGLVLGIPQTLEYFQRMQDRITNFVTQNSNITKERFTSLSMNTQELVMDVGTVLDGPEAVEEGLIDSLGSLSDAIDCLEKMIDKEKKRKSTTKKKKSE